MGSPGAARRSAAGLGLADGLAEHPELGPRLPAVTRLTTRVARGGGVAPAAAPRFAPLAAAVAAAPAAAAAAKVDVDAGASGRRKRLFALTYAAYVVMYFARKPLSVLKPVLKQELGLTQTQLGGVDTAFLAAYAVGQLAIGSSSRHLSVQTMLTVSYVLAGLGTAMVGLSSSATAMAGWSALVGYAAACTNPLLVLFISDLFPPEVRASVVGLWQTSAQFGGIAANNYASAMLSAAGWRAVFLSAGALVMLTALPIRSALASQGTPAAPAAAPAAAAVLKAGSKGAKVEVAPVKAVDPAPGTAEVLTLPGVLSVSMCYMLVKMARYCLMLWLPTFLANEVGMSAASAGAMASVFDAGGVLGGVFAGVATDKLLGGKLIGTVVCLCALCSCSLVGWSAVVAKGQAGGTQSAALNCAAMALTGFLIAGPDGILGGAAVKNVCEYNGVGVSGDGWGPAVSGLVNGLASLGVIGMSAGTSQLVDALGWAGLYKLQGAMLGSAAVLAVPALILEAKHFQKKASAKAAATGVKAKAK